MSRNKPRAEASNDKATQDRAQAIRLALAYLVGSTDPTVTGATVLLPDGEALYLDVAAAKAERSGGGAS